MSACAGGTASVWIKPGVPAIQAQQDEVTCLRQASAVVPERPRVTTAPRIRVGGSVCEGAVCVGLDTFPDVFETDTNAPRRNQAFGACMGAKGYRLAVLPRCPGAAQVLVSHPFETAGLCVAQGQIAAPR